MTTASRLQALTPREREVLDLAVKGLSCGEIAQLLGISPRTAEIHKQNMTRKMDTSNMVELTRMMMEYHHEQELEQFNEVWIGTVLTMFKRVA